MPEQDTKRGAAHRAPERARGITKPWRQKTQVLCHFKTKGWTFSKHECTGDWRIDRGIAMRSDAARADHELPLAWLGISSSPSPPHGVDAVVQLNPRESDLA